MLCFYKRLKKYRYNQKADYIYNLKSNSSQEQADSKFLKVILKPNLLSYFFKPYIEIDGVKTYFEYGAKGIRYINISHINSLDIKSYFIDVEIKKDIFSFNNDINLNDKILILAPHADDAEIASFGLYSKAKDVTVVTITIGENGNNNYKRSYNDSKKAIYKKAELRTFDAICTPFLGGVDFEKSITLGYNGGSLTPMKQNKTINSSLKDITPFRKTKHSNIKLADIKKPTYKTFLDDISKIIDSVKPDIIITPHPQIDSHLDHKQTTLTLLEVLEKSDLDPKLLLYTNHLELSELYPIGEVASSITLPPNRTDFIFDSVYSFKLDVDTQIDKFFALENIHDLRNSYLQNDILSVLKQLIKLIKRKVKSKDKSYYKRAVRDNELFFVAKKVDFKPLKEV